MPMEVCTVRMVAHEVLGRNSNREWGRREAVGTIVSQRTWLYFMPILSLSGRLGLKLMDQGGFGGFE